MPDVVAAVSGLIALLLARPGPEFSNFFAFFRGWTNRKFQSGMKKYLARSPSRSRRTISLAPRPESEPNGISQVRAKMATHTDTRVQRRVSQKANKPLGEKINKKRAMLPASLPLLIDHQHSGRRGSAISDMLLTLCRSEKGNLSLGRLSETIESGSSA